MDINRSEFWSDRYRLGEHGWDLRGETAVFRALRERGEFPVSPLQEGRASKLWIPGCGFGHDALGFAGAGYAVTAVDFAPEPLAFLSERAREEGVYIQTVEADIFDVPQGFSESFDVVLEYTCYCAIAPERRMEYMESMAKTLRTGGFLVGLFFPMDGRAGGPPFSVTETEIVDLAEKAGMQKILSAIPPESHPARAGKEQLMIFRKI